MTIEAGPKPNGVRTAAADTRNQKNKSAASGGQGGGFGAILASMDSSETVDSSVVAPVDVPVSADLVGVSTAPVSDGRDSSAKDLASADPFGARRMDKGLDALGLAESDAPTELGDGKKLLPKDPLDALATPATLVTVAAAVFTQAPMDAAALLPQASQWSSASLQNIQSENQGPAAGAAQFGVVGTKPKHPVVKPEGASAGPLALDALAEIPVKPGKLQRDTAAKQALAGDGLTVNVPSAQPIESRSLSLAVKSVEQMISPVVVPLTVAGTPMLTRRDDQARERSVFRSNATEGSALGQSFLSTSASTAVQYTPDLQMSPDVYVAEKVAYWISNDVQSAEMKLDGIGLDPVEVSIRMHGNEAHVAFRTDELQARTALENAGTHLKEMLQREGLVLTGVSVGTAGAGDSGDREGKSRQGGRQTSIAALTPVHADRGGVAGRVAGGVLDLFV